MSEMDRRAFVGAAALGSVAATVLTASSVQAAGQAKPFTQIFLGAVSGA
jgi:hypothetical protein